MPQPSSGESGIRASTDRETARSGSKRPETMADSREMNSLLKTLRVKVPRFDGTNVDDWVYKIYKFFLLAQG